MPEPAPAGTETTPPDRKEIVYQAVTALATGTAGEIATQAAIPYSTVTPKLRALADDGRIEAYRDDEGRTRWRHIAASEADVLLPDTVNTPEAPDVEDAPDTGTDDDGSPDAEEPSAPSATLDQRTEAAADADDPSAPGSVKAERRRKGAVPEAILAAFAEAEPGTTYKVTQLHHLTGISQGAIAVAMVKLIDKGQVVQTVERPATYQAVAPQ